MSRAHHPPVEPGLPARSPSAARPWRAWDPEIRRVLLHYWRIAEVRAWHIALPLLLAVLAALADGGSLSLLIPLSDGVAAGGFQGLQESRWFGWIAGAIPTALRDPDRRDVLIAITLLALLLAARMLKLGLEYARAWFLSARDERYQAVVAEETFGRVLGFGREYFDRRPVGHVDAEISWSSSVPGFLSALEALVLHGLRLSVKVAVVLAISLPLFVSLLVSFGLLQLLHRRLARSVGRLAEDLATIQKSMRRQVLDLLGNIPLVKVSHEERRARAAHREVLREAERIGIHRRRLNRLGQNLEEATVLLGALVTEGFVLALDPASPALHLARFCAFFLVAQQCIPDLNGLSASSLAAIDQIPRLRSLALLFRDEGKCIVPSGRRTFRGLEHGIEARGLRFGYAGGPEVLTGVDATFPAGRITALVGGSGAGKSTLAYLVARLYDVPPRTLFFDGVDVREFDVESLHRHIALVSQDTWLLDRSLRENLAFGLPEPPTDAVLWGALGAVGLEDIFQGLPAGLDAQLGVRGLRLSGGQRQRVALARTLLRDPGVLILDEATAALDGILERQVVNAVERTLGGRTVIVIAHRLSTVRNADRILVMESGRIVESGTWTELLAAGGAFHALYEAQADGAHRWAPTWSA